MMSQSALSSGRLLRRYPLFAPLRSQQLAAWLSLDQDVTALTGETLLQADTEGVCAYLLLEGQVRVVRASEKRGEVSVGCFGPGDLFGEYALLPPGRNTATCRAATPSRVIRLPLPAVAPYFVGHPQVWPNFKNWLRLHTLLHYLRGRSFLGFMSAPSGLALLDHLKSVTFAAGETVQAGGLAGDRWFVVEQGRVRVAADELGPGDCFGERGLLWGARVPAAEAVTEARCMSLARTAFDPPPDGGHGQSLQSLLPSRPGGPRSYAWVGQEEASDCGLAALCMVARHHGIEVPLAELRRFPRVRARGLSLLDLRRLGGKLGLSCRAVRVDPGRLDEVTPPAVAHLGEGHYVVVYAHGAAGLVVGDPAVGIVTLTPSAFSRACSGHLLLCQRVSQGGRR
jgi:CRP-like cAMP-binding protein